MVVGLSRFPVAVPGSEAPLRSLKFVSQGSLDLLSGWATRPVARARDFPQPNPRPSVEVDGGGCKCPAVQSHNFLGRNPKEVRPLKMRIASLVILCLCLAAIPALADSYNNGPINGTTDAWTINFGYVVSDSLFTFEL